MRKEIIGKGYKTGNSQHLAMSLFHEMSTPHTLEDIQFCKRGLIYRINDALWPMLDGSLSPQYGASSGCGWKKWPPSVNTLNKQQLTAEKGWCSSLGGRGGGVWTWG
jgi:hypothetical protein